MLVAWANLTYTATDLGGIVPEKRYIIPLSEVDQMVVRQDRSGHDVLNFSVQLEILVAGHWRKAMRFDSSHGQPHRHVFYPDGKEYREVMATQNNNVAFTEAQQTLTESFTAIHERYVTYMERMIE